LEVPSLDDRPPGHYAALLPREYHPGRAYPLIVALRPQGKTVEDALAFWGGSPEKPGQGQRYGYIVIAPEYADAGQREYDSSTEAHRRVLEALYDARKRFHVDSDRVFLVGHGMGGDAVFDIAFSHPDLFAGAIPIGGVAEKFCKFYTPNVKHLPLYVVNGELDRNSATQTYRDLLLRLMNQNTDVIYAEYVGRGQEHFYFESPKFFEWMARQKRQRFVKEIEAKALRPTDNRFWWWEFSGFPANNALAVWSDEKGRVSPLNVVGKVTPGNTIVLQCGAKHHSLYLSPEVIDFEKRVVVRWGSGQKWNDFLKPNIGDMLEDFRLRADRQRLTWFRLDF
jgi:pimeloyl-ACP methyl ester carboxylesterase